MTVSVATTLAIIAGAHFVAAAADDGSIRRGRRDGAVVGVQRFAKSGTVGEDAPPPKSLCCFTGSCVCARSSPKESKKTTKGEKKSKKHSKKQTPPSHYMDEKLCPKDLFEGSYLYFGCDGKGFLASITCSESDDDTCYYSERVVNKDDEEEDPCPMGGKFVPAENIKYNVDTGACELAYFDLSDDDCDLYPEEEGGLGLKAEINMNSEMSIWFTSDFGETYYNEENPRRAFAFPSTVEEDRFGGADRALSEHEIRSAKERRRSRNLCEVKKCEDCAQYQVMPWVKDICCAGFDEAALNCAACDD